MNNLRQCDYEILEDSITIRINKEQSNVIVTLLLWVLSIFLIGVLVAVAKWFGVIMAVLTLILVKAESAEPIQAVINCKDRTAAITTRKSLFSRKTQTFTHDLSSFTRICTLEQRCRRGPPVCGFLLSNSKAEGLSLITVWLTRPQVVGEREEVDLLRSAIAAGLGINDGGRG